MDEQTPIITVEVPHLPTERFETYLEATRSELVADGNKRPSFYRNCKGEKLEPIVYDKMCALASDFGFSSESIRRTPKQHFPDIMAQDYYGVEVKSTKNDSWCSTGSTISESLRDKYAQKIYIMFGKLSGKRIDFRCGSYEECLCEIYVTHNPRYKIDMDMKSRQKTIFDKMGVPYEEFRRNPKRIEILKDYYRKKCRANKNGMPWWMEDEDDDENEEDMEYMPATLEHSSMVRLYGALTVKESSYLKMCAYILFPEILGTEKNKYRNLALWLCSRFSVISPNVRDSFTAGGQADIYVDGLLVYAKAPRVLCNFLKTLEKIYDIFHRKVDVYKVINIYASYKDTDKDYFETWKELVNKYLSSTDRRTNSFITNIFDLRFKEENKDGIFFEMRK